MNTNKNKLLKRSDLIDIIFASFMAELGAKRVELLIEYALQLPKDPEALSVMEHLMELLVEQLPDSPFGQQTNGGEGHRFIANVLKAVSDGDKLVPLDAISEKDILLTLLLRRVPQSVLREIFDDVDRHVSAEAGRAVYDLVDEIRVPERKKEEVFAEFKAKLDPSLRGPTTIEQQRGIRGRQAGGSPSSLLAALLGLTGGGFPPGSLPEGLDELSRQPGVRVISLNDLLSGGPRGGKRDAFEEFLQELEGRSGQPEPDGSVTLGDLWSAENQTFGLTRAVEDFLRLNRPRTDNINMNGVRGLPLRLFKDMTVLALRYRETFPGQPEEAEQLIKLVNIIHADIVRDYGTVDEAIATFLAKHPERAEGERQAADRQKVVDEAVAKGEPTPDCGCPACNLKRRARGEKPVVERPTSL